MVTSTSRATGKVTAMLVMTAACISQNAAPYHRQTSAQRPLPVVEETSFAPVGVGRASEGSSSGGAVSTALSGQRIEASIETAANEELASPARTTLSKEGRAVDTETSEEVAVVTGAGATGSGSGGEGFVPCRQKASGPLRGGDLM